MKATKIKDTKSRMYRTLTLLHADKDGGPVLIDGRSWWRRLGTVNGIMLSTDRTGTWCWEFRRVGR